METAVLGGGCFWCVEALLQKLKGVSKVTPGYCGGESVQPKYEDVKTGNTGHIEVVEVVFDPSQLTYEQLLNVFMKIHDPTQEKGQGEDIGTQYVSAVFYLNSEQKEVAQKVIDKLASEAAVEGKKVFTQVRERMPFYEAEQYHHNYYNIRGSENPYCDIIPGKIAKMRHLFKQMTIDQD